jgi:hypothetical protein
LIGCLSYGRAQKEEKQEVADKKEEEKKEEEKKKRQGRARFARGNLHLIQKPNKDAAKVAMKGGKPKFKEKRKRKALKNKTGGTAKKQSAWDLLMRKLFGTWTQEPVTLRDEKAKAAAKALQRRSRQSCPEGVRLESAPRVATVCSCGSNPGSPEEVQDGLR